MRLGFNAFPTVPVAILCGFTRGLRVAFVASGFVVSVVKRGVSKGGRKLGAVKFLSLKVAGYWRADELLVKETPSLLQLFPNLGGRDMVWLNCYRANGSALSLKLA